MGVGIFAVYIYYTFFKLLYVKPSKPVEVDIARV